MLDGYANDLIPPDDADRLKKLREFDILYTSAEEAFDNITQMMAQVFGAPMSFISLVDEDAVFYKSQTGPFGRDQVRREDSLCSLTILNDRPLVITDASAEQRLSNSPYVAAEGGIRFYAGAPLITKEGYKIGTACIVGLEPRSFSGAEKELLVRFANMVMHEIEMRQAVLKQAMTEEQLLTANKELQFVTDTVPQLVWTTEPEGHAFFFNKGWLQYSGLPLEDITGDGWRQLLHPDDRRRTAEAWQLALQTGVPYDVEHRLKRHDGEFRWFVSRAVPMLDLNGNIEKWYGTSTDIHDQKTVHEVLHLAEERFNLVAKATQDVIWDWNLVTNGIWWNEGFQTQFGYGIDDIEPDVSSRFNRVHPADKDRVVGGIDRVIQNGGSQWADEYRFRRKDGSCAIVLDRGYILQDAGGKPYRMLGSMQDITASRMQQEKIRENESRFQAAVDALEGILWTNNAAGEMEGEQPGWSLLTGQHYEDYRGYGWTAVIHPDDTASTLAAWQIAVQQTTTFTTEHRVKTKDGQWRLFAVRAIPVLTANGEVKEWVGVHTDITVQRLAEEAIRESEQRFQNLVREATVGIIVLKGKEKRVDLVNEAYSRLIGRRPDEILNRNIFDVIPEARAAFEPVIEQVRTSGEPFYLYDQPYRVFYREKEIEGYLNLVYQPYKEANGVTSGVMVLCQDITVQVLARKKADEAEEIAGLAIESAGLGTFQVDLRSNDIIASARLDEIFEVPPTNDRKQYVDAIHPNDRHIRTEAYERAFQSGLLDYECRVVRKSGSLRWVRVKGRVLFKDDEQPVKLTGVVQDITEEKEFAHELTRQVQERTQDLEQFSYVSHHDLQEPLRKIIMFTGLAQADANSYFSEVAATRLGKVVSAAMRMSTALKDVLNFASLNRQDLFTAVNLNTVLADVQTDLELSIHEKNAIVELDHLPTINAVPQQMHQLFYNLVNNALKFKKPEGQPLIRVQCRTIPGTELKHHADLSPDKAYYWLTVKDNGIGFDQKAAGRIFILFQRLHSRDAYAGTGIGLALCKKVVQNHQGRIWAEGNPGEGACFHVILPA